MAVLVANQSAQKKLHSATLGLQRWRYQFGILGVSGERSRAFFRSTKQPRMLTWRVRCDSDTGSVASSKFSHSVLQTFEKTAWTTGIDPSSGGALGAAPAGGGGGAGPAVPGARFASKRRGEGTGHHRKGPGPGPRHPSASSGRVIIAATHRSIDTFLW